MESETLKSRLTALTRRSDRSIADKEANEKELSRLLKSLDSLNQEMEDSTNALDYVRVTAQKVQSALEMNIKNISNSALSSVFGDKYTLGMDFSMKRNNSEIDLYLLDKETGCKVKPMDACGGGVVDLLSMALRITMWSLKRPRTRPIMVLDEPFKFLSKDLKPMAAEMIKSLSQALGIQFIIVTHENDIIESSDKVFDLTKGKVI